MPNTRALGRRLSCLVVGLVDGSPISSMLSDAGFEVTHSVAAQDTLKALEGPQHWGVVFVADSLGRPALQSIIDRSSTARPPSPVVVVATNGSSDTLAATILQLGAFDFIGPPFTPEVLENKLRRLSVEGPAPDGATPQMEHLGLVGSSAAMARVKQAIARIARYKTDVLVCGESGSGKETIARALHEQGPRRGERFVAVSCSGASRDVLESELFGDEASGKKGLLESAEGGTLFLDEVADLDPSTQAKLMRVLERNEVRPGTGARRADLNVIASTERDLDQAVAARRFREDLYDRLKVVTVMVPPLRERREDIPELAKFFLDDFNRRNDGNLRGLSAQALERLVQHDWPGNVRELKHALESAAVMAASDTIGLLDFQEAYFKRREPSAGTLAGPGRPLEGDLLTIPATATLSDVERIVIAEHLRRARTKADAARSLGMGLRTLYTKIGKFQLTEVARTNRSRNERS